jgi:NADH-dependant formate dehydrogenase delta subunit FdsD
MKDRLVLMINQIATNLASQGEASAIAQATQHIRHFWSPAMQADLRAQKDSATDLLHPISRAVIEQLDRAA